MARIPLPTEARDVYDGKGMEMHGQPWLFPFAGHDHVTPGLKLNSMVFPRPKPKLVVVHSPTPSRVMMAADSKGEGKKALAAWDSIDR